MSICLDPKNVETSKPIGPKCDVATYMNIGQILG